MALARARLFHVFILEARFTKIATFSEIMEMWINPKVGTEWALKLGLQCGAMALKLRKLGKESLQRDC
jgi:hypothetical protein